MAEPLGNEPLQYKNLTRTQQSTANRIVSDFGSNFSMHARTAGKQMLEGWDRNPTPQNKAKRAKGRRLIDVADNHLDKPMTLASAARNRVDAVNAAATSQRLPSETMAGAGWYFDAHRDIAKVSHGLPVDKVATASSAMSPGTDPESERHAAGALAAAHANPNANVHFSSDLVAGLRAAGHHVPVPVGSTLHISQVPAHLVPAMAHESQQATVSANSTGVDWQGINRVASRVNIEKATKIMRGETPLHEAQNPHGAPKTSSYTDNLMRAVPDTPEHMEYTMRADHLAGAIRGEHHGGQAMFDYHGLRGSNEGILSNNGHTAEDSWMRAVSVGHRNPDTMKGAGDIGPTRKSYTTHEDTGTVVHSVSRDARVNGNAMYHAWNNEATHRAAQTLQKQHSTEFTVPSTLVQETAWTAKRREVGADPQYNKANRASAAAAKAEAKATKPTTPTSADLLPGMNSAQFKRMAKGARA